jgi:pimeloyl-ACP methyl ester carboxylesterase
VGAPPRGVTPAARALARRLGLGLERVAGTGPGGRVTKEDVEAAVAGAGSLLQVAPGVALEVLAEGAGDPVLLLPGFGTDVAAFARQVPALAGCYRVLGVNPRGVGASRAPEGERSDVAVAARDAAALCTAPAHVIGASLGAAVAMELALQHPARVRSLILLTPFLEASARLLAVVDAWCRVAAEACPETLARTLLPWLFSGAFLADTARRERTARGLAEMTARLPARTLMRTAAGLRTWVPPRPEALARLVPPTLVVLAADDLLTPDGQAVASAVPGAECVVIPGAGHAVALEAPEAVNAAIIRFLGAH